MKKFNLFLSTVTLIFGLVFVPISSSAQHRFATQDPITTQASCEVLQQAIQSNPRMMGNMLQLHLASFSFPTAYFDLWNHANPGLYNKTLAVLRDYIDHRFYGHYRHFTSHPKLREMIDRPELEGNTQDELQVLQVLSELREVFDSRFSQDLYGFVDFEESFFHRTPDLIWNVEDSEAKSYRQIQKKPGSLYARARFILIQTLKSYANRIAAATQNGTTFELSLDEQKLVLSHYQYYLMNSFVDRKKESTSLGRKAGKIAVTLAVGSAIAFGIPAMGFLAEPCRLGLHLLAHLGSASVHGAVESSGLLGPACPAGIAHLVVPH